MLRIKVERDSNRIVVYASGSLTGLSVSQLERCWKSMSDASVGSPMRLDFGGITSVDKIGKTLLSQMVANGVQFQADGPRMTPVAGSIICKLIKG